MLNYCHVIEEPTIIEILQEIANGTLGEDTTFDYDGHKFVYDGEDIRTVEEDYYDADVKTHLYLSEIIDLSNLNDKVTNFQRVYHLDCISTSTYGEFEPSSITKIKPTNWHYTFNQSKEVKCCPVCSGRGFVSGGFYSSTGNTWVTSTTTPDKCRTCHGKGYIEI